MNPFACRHTKRRFPPPATLLVFLGLWAAGVPPAAAADNAPEPQRFEAAAWVDHFDFAGTKKPDHTCRFDTETDAGCRAILEHVLETGATSVWWRNCGGSTMRYPSAVESHHNPETIDKRRLPDNRPIHGWVRYGNARPDILANILEVCASRKIAPGVHWPFEENHFANWTLGSWNLDHPQYWCRTPQGTPWCGRASIAYPEVIEHKLALLDELIARGMDTLFIDTFRSGGWTPAMEYVPPVTEAWKAKYHIPPPNNPRDPRWCAHVATYVTAYMKKIRARLDASGRRIRFLVGVFGIAPIDDLPLRERGLDWQSLIREGVIDGVVINTVRWQKKDPFGSTRKLYREVLRAVDGRGQVLCPVRAYNYGGYGIPAYREASGLSQAETAARLVRIAWECGADGISLECVDYDNYKVETRQVMRQLLQGPCRYKKKKNP